MSLETKANCFAPALSVWLDPRMKRIARLDRVTAEQIAAGEVIERPGSVVKELVENALDAGATEIQVVLTHGGKSLIEVTDNGQGIVREDLALALERHATSKITRFDDLLSLATLGFRGEALAAISVAGSLNLVSRAKTSVEVFRVRPGETPESITHGHFLGSPYGTRVQVENLFSQMPARLKFLKSPSSELAFVREWLERLSLTHPAVGFRLISDGRTTLQLKAGQSELERVRTILAGNEDFPIQIADSRDEGRGDSYPRVKLYWVQGLSLAQSRKILQVVNGRVLKDRFLQQAILSPLKQSFLPGQFPAIAMFLETDPATIDVNVHPTKTEVRFLDSGRVFQAIASLGETLISQRGAPAFVAGALDSHRPFATSSSASVSQFTPASAPGATFAPAVFTTAPESSWGEAIRSKDRFTAPFQFQNFTPAASTTDDPFLDRSEAATPALESKPHPFPEMQFARFTGILFQTYLLYDLGREMVVIDQHAAHERIRYETLKARLTDSSRPLTPQLLLVPEVVQVDADKIPTVLKNLESLNARGFEAEAFGDEKILVRAVPAEWGSDSLKTRLASLFDRIAEPDFNGSLIDETLFEALASEACHSAVRAHDALTRDQAESITRTLFQCEHPWNCPHGRPTVVRVPESRFSEWFLRLV